MFTLYTINFTMFALSLFTFWHLSIFLTLWRLSCSGVGWYWCCHCSKDYSLTQVLWSIWAGNQFLLLDLSLWWLLQHQGKKAFKGDIGTIVLNFNKTLSEPVWGEVRSPNSTVIRDYVRYWAWGLHLLQLQSRGRPQRKSCQGGRACEKTGSWRLLQGAGRQDGGPARMPSKLPPQVWHLCVVLFHSLGIGNAHNTKLIAQSNSRWISAPQDPHLHCLPQPRVAGNPFYPLHMSGIPFFYSSWEPNRSSCSGWGGLVGGN